jgi:hypothetical protein
LQYTYRCPRHGEFRDTFRGDSFICDCGERSRRIWSFRADTDFQPYYSPSFGQVINSRQHAKQLAKIANEEHFARHGVEAHYEVIDTHDDEAVNIDTAEKEYVAEETRRHAVNGAAWSQERFAEIKAEKDRLRAEKESVDA